MAARRRRARGIAHAVRVALRLPLPFLAVLAAAAIGLFLAACLLQLKDLIMKNRIAAACALLAVAVALSACSPLSALSGPPGQASSAEVLKAIGEHMDGCDRSYQGGLGVGASFTFNIECKAKVGAVSAPAASASAAETK